MYLPHLIAASSDEAPDVEFFEKTYAIAQQTRAEIWRDFASRVENGGLASADLQEIGSLFCTLRLDLNRAMLAIAQGGLCENIPIDPIPADLSHPAFLEEKRNLSLVLSAAGLTEMDLTDPAAMAQIARIEAELRQAGQLDPGLSGC